MHIQTIVVPINNAPAAWLAGDTARKGYPREGIAKDITNAWGPLPAIKITTACTIWNLWALSQ